MTGDGLVLIDKPSGWTSHDVVARTRRLAGTKKVGHAGTLDPMATGLLVLGVNKATRLLTYLVGADKTYTATIRLGQSTNTDDAEGDVTSAPGTAGVDAAALAAAIRDLTGPIDQVPSAVSAIKVDGKRAYARVRAGEQVALQARPVRIHSFDATGSPQHATADDGTAVVDLPVRIECSSGTYIRALARDLGTALGTGGHLTALRRTRVGVFDIAAAQELPVPDGGEPLALIDLTRACTTLFETHALSPEHVIDVGHGRSIPGGSRTSPVAAIGTDGQVVALLEGRAGTLKPALVFVPS